MSDALLEVSMKRVSKVVWALALWAVAGTASATCVPSGNGGVCTDALAYVEEDPTANAIQFRMLALDENLLTCTKTADGEFQISRNDAMFNERHQVLLLAVAGALRVRVEISNTPGACVVTNVRLLGTGS